MENFSFGADSTDPGSAVRNRSSAAEGGFSSINDNNRLSGDNNIQQPSTTDQDYGTINTQTTPTGPQKTPAERRVEEEGVDGLLSTGNAEKPPPIVDKYATNDEETLVHLLKANIGPGILALPQAFKNSGLWVGMAGIFIFGGVCAHATHMVVYSSKELCRLNNRLHLTYEETAFYAFERGPKKLRRFAPFVQFLIKLFLALTQFGFCTVYFVFVPQNLKQALECMTGGTGVSQFGFQAAMILPALLFCYIPELKMLAPVSMMAGTLKTIGLILTFYYLVKDLGGPNHNPVPGFAGWETLPLYFGSAIYAIGGIGIVMPLENKMATPRNYPGWTGVLNTGLMLCVIMYATVGFYGYYRYGDAVQGSITLSLPAGELLAQIIKILIAISVFLGYPLQFYVPLTYLIPAVRKHFSSTRTKFIAEYTMRTVIVLITFTLASAIPNIGLFVSLIGAVASTTLALLIPPFVEICTYWSEKEKRTGLVIKGSLIFGLGLLGFVTGTVSSIMAIVRFFNSGRQEPPFSCE